MRSAGLLVRIPCVMVSLVISACALAASPFPLQIELRVPFEPTAFPSGGETYLMYELYLTNFSGSAIDLRSIETFDVDDRSAKPLAAFEGKQIGALLQSSDAQVSTDRSNLRRVNADETLVVFMQIVLPTQAHVPKRLKHRVSTTDSVVEGAFIGTNHTELKVLAAPLRGGAWHAYDGPSNDRVNHHRRGLFISDGRLSISRRYATDWFLIKDDAQREGNEHDPRSYYSYDQPVFAVASGTIVTARDGLPDNVPGPVETFRTAVPKTLETISGNTIVLNLGNGQFASYFHLRPGSVRVKTGDRVEKGELLARVGVSGDSNLPHLHFEISTTPEPLSGEGVPYVFEKYDVKTAGGEWRPVTRELPIRDALVDFGTANAHP